MPSIEHSRRRRIVWVTIGLAALATIAIVGPPLSFHLLPPTWTGEADRLARVLQLSAGETVAEIGAGRGALAMSMHERVQPGGRLYATELDPVRLQQLRQRGAGKLIVIEATESSVGIPEDCCQAIYMRNVYHHIGDIARFNKQLLRALQSEGRLAVIDFEPGTLPFNHARPPGASPRRSGHGVEATAVAQELEAAGFSVERIESDWGGWMFLVVAVAP